MIEREGMTRTPCRFFGPNGVMQREKPNQKTPKDKSTHIPNGTLGFVIKFGDGWCFVTYHFSGW